MLESIKKLRDRYYKPGYKGEPTLEQIAGAIEREISDRYMPLPVDADGVPIRVGDEVKFRSDAPVRVDSIGTSRVCGNDWGFFASNGAFFGQGTLCNVQHVKERTVEDVLEEFGRKFAENYHYPNADGLVSETADELREMLGGDA